MQKSLGVDLNQEFHTPNEASKAEINLSTLQVLESLHRAQSKGSPEWPQGLL